MRPRSAGGRTSFALQQIAKDKISMATIPPTMAGVVWHFFASSVSGKVGPSPAVLKALIDAKIPFYIHLPRS